MAGFKYFIERVAFHFPLLHEWLAERDDLRRKNASTMLELDSLRSEYKSVSTRLSEYKSVSTRLKELERHLWIEPGHFMSPIPALDELETDRDRIFAVPRTMEAIDLNEKAQFEILDRFVEWYKDQPFTPDKVPGRRYYFENPNYSYGDAITLYCMMRYLNPRRIIEVGSGYSSCVMLDVNDLFFDGRIFFTFIDPNSWVVQGLISDNDRRQVRLLPKRVQDVPVEVFRELQANDILFIDSSHVSKTGSDVNYLMFDVLPHLNEGVYIHFHDIFYPFEYPSYLVFEGRAWNEIYLLRAFLSYNRAFEIRFLTTYLFTYFRERFDRDFPMYVKSPGGSIWLRKNGSS